MISTIVNIEHKWLLYRKGIFFDVFIICSSDFDYHNNNEKFKIVLTELTGYNNHHILL